MKKLLMGLLAIIIGLNVARINTVANEQFEDIPHLLVYSVDSDEVIIGKNIDQRVYPASVTKILLALVSYEAITDMDEKVTVTEEDLAGLGLRGASVVGLKLGNVISYSDLLHSLIVISAGDSAQILGNHLFGSEEEAVKAMNKKAEELGMTSSHFVNVTGLHDEDHYTTVNDLLKLVQATRLNDTLRGIMSTMKYSISVDEESKQIVFMHTIQMAKTEHDIIENYITGGKTGSTNESGSNFVSFGEAGGLNYIVILIGVNADDENFTAVKKAVTVYGYLDQNYQEYNIWQENHQIAEFKIRHSKSFNYILYSKNELNRLVDKTIPLDQIEQVYHMEESYEAPLKAGDVLGSVDLIYKGELLSSYDIVMDQDVELNQSVVILEQLINYWYLVLAIVAMIAAIIYLQVKKVKERNKTRYRL